MRVLAKPLDCCILWSVGAASTRWPPQDRCSRRVGDGSEGDWRAGIKKIIADVANLDPARSTTRRSFIEDLELDSLSLLEIGVDIDYQFKLGVSDERLKELRSVEDAIELVQQVRSDKQAASGGG